MVSYSGKTKEREAHVRLESLFHLLFIVMAMVFRAQQGQKNMLGKITAQFYRTVLLSVAMSAFLIAGVFLFPINTMLTQEIHGRFVNAVELRALYVNYTLGRFIADIAALTSRTAIRHQLLLHSRGEIGFQELVAFSTPKYADGARVIKDLVGVRRILPDGAVVCSHGDQEIFHGVSADTPGIFLLSAAESTKMLVVRPIIESERVIGYDAGIFNADFMFEGMPQEVRRFSLISASEVRPMESERKHRAQLSDVPFFLEGEMETSLLDSAKRQSLLIVSLYTFIALLILLALFYFTQFRFFRNIIERLHRETRQKEALLRETHHRIKNNLNGIVAMLQMQMDTMESSETRRALNEAVGRVYSMSELYTKMLAANRSQEIDLGEFLGDIVERAVSLFTYTRKIHVEKRFDRILLGGEVLFPLGLIANELATNAAKYAFQENQTGILEVSGIRDGDVVSLSIRDNGRGFPEGFTAQDSAGFGISLVHILVEQIGGDIRFENDSGAKVTIVFNAPAG
ncbi:MAG: hypothetical protein CVV55_04470 [Synergistetes bacterium HGW-Synergistetes-2]|nr:MAG: hypothetical protein CVV55_04470 [Synergistetes bacterium HGW-Synergistetes-2]